MKKVFTFNSQVWRWPGDMGWHFVTLPKKLSAEVKGVGKRYGAGFVKVKVTLRKSSWITALFPHKESGAYLLSIKQNIRKKEGVWEGDKIQASFTLE